MATSVDAIAKVAKSRAFIVLALTICVVLSYVWLLSKSGRKETKGYEHEDGFIGKWKTHFCLEDLKLELECELKNTFSVIGSFSAFETDFCED